MEGMGDEGEKRRRGSMEKGSEMREGSEKF
jgi:hypothetical protein